MIFTEEQVEWIVSEVVRRLMLQAANERVAVGERSSTTAELTIDSKLVTMRTIEGKLTGINQLRVPARAIVTPAAKDELKQRQITLVRQP
jgi:hypothetical protein